MNDLDQRVIGSFDALKAPERAKASALAHIEAVRRASQVSEGSSTSQIPASRTAAPERATSNRRHPQRARRWAAAIAACLILACVGAFGYNTYTSPTAFVGLDINPSIEFSINRFERVVDVKSLNDDGRALLESCPSLTGKPYEDALDTVLSCEGFQAYAAEDALVAVDVVSEDEAQATQLLTQSQQQLASLPCQTQCHRTDEATRESAHHAGMGMGRYRAAQELIEADSSYTLEECASMSMHQIKDACAAAHGSSVDTADAADTTDASDAEDAPTPSLGQHRRHGQGHHS